MLAKKFALGFGIAIILPMLVNYGVSVFSPSPRWRDYHGSEYYQGSQGISLEQKAKLNEERKKQTDKYRNAQKVYQRNLFFVSVPVGIISIILGSVILIQAVGTGLMFGGIFTLIYGYCWYWSELQDWMRFLSLLAAFAVLIFIGYRKLAK